MNANEFCRLAGRLQRLPTAPYHEHRVREEVERVCREHRLACRRDAYGNLLVQYSPSPGLRPLVLAAHLDHPGFELVEQVSAVSWRARFRGTVPLEYFRPGVKVRLQPGDEAARLAGALPGEKMYLLKSSRAPRQAPAFAVWDLEAFRVAAGRITARACDDLIGVAAALATLLRLRRARARVNVIAALSRAEEVGFHGALALAGSGKLPRRSTVISLETSRELPGVAMGAGVILRVGDRASIFNSDATRFLAEVAADTRRRRFRFQRALMSGGTCEATAYQEAGYQSAAVCVALGNYHNAGPNHQVRAEYVSVADCMNMVTLLEQAARQVGQYRSLTNRLRVRLRKLGVEARRELPKSAQEDRLSGRRGSPR